MVCPLQSKSKFCLLQSKSKVNLNVYFKVNQSKWKIAMYVHFNITNYDHFTLTNVCWLHSSFYVYFASLFVLLVQSMFKVTLSKKSLNIYNSINLSLEFNLI